MTWRRVWLVAFALNVGSVVLNAVVTSTGGSVEFGWLNVNAAEIPMNAACAAYAWHCARRPA